MMRASRVYWLFALLRASNSGACYAVGYMYLYEQRSSAANRIPYLRKEEDRVLLAEGEKVQTACMASGQLHMH